MSIFFLVDVWLAPVHRKKVENVTTLREDSSDSKGPGTSLPAMLSGEA